jgi:hypothetical protein
LCRFLKLTTTNGGYLTETLYYLAIIATVEDVVDDLKHVNHVVLHQKVRILFEELLETGYGVQVGDG